MKKMLTLCVALALLLGMALPGQAEAQNLPDCFVPQQMAMYFNSLLGPTLELLGAPNAQTLAEQYKLTNAQVAGSVLFLSSEDGRVELNAFYQDGEAAVDKVATTLGLAVSNDVDRSELLSLAATFAVVLSELDSSLGDFDALLNWMSDAADAGKAEMKTLNGYMLVYVKNDQGNIFTLMPAAAESGDSGDGGSGTDVIEPEPAPEVTPEPAPEVTPEPAPEPTPEPAPDPTPEPTPEPAPEPERPADLPDSLDGAVLANGGVWVAPLSYEVHTYSGGDATLWIYFRVLNDTAGEVHVQTSDGTVDGVAVYCGTIGTYGPYSDTGAKPDDFLLIMSDSGNEEESCRAIANASKVNLTLVVKDEHFNELCSENVTLDLTKMKGTRDEPREDSTPTKAPKASGNDSPAPKASYRTLSKGDKGDDVKRLQEKLIELGYLNDVADGSYGPKTAAAVKALNEANGLGSSSSADAVTQDMVFSGLAKAYSEPWIPVDVPYTQWNNITGDGASYRVKITNTSKTRTIKGLALQFYVTDVWGDRPWGSTIYREFTDTQTIKPGETKYSNWWYMTPSWYSIDQIHFRVAKVAFSDGEVHENYDEDFNWNVSLH